jgi:uncharacterized protein (TIGR02452 family)
MNRTQRAQLAQETLAILESGSYRLPSDRIVSIRDHVAASCASTKLYRPADYDSILASLPTQAVGETTIRHVSNQTTLEAAYALSASYTNIVCLNFASAKNPGGFLSGRKVEHESRFTASSCYSR